MSSLAKQRLLDALVKTIGESAEGWVRDVAKYGAFIGVPGLTYYAETCRFYDQHADDIWEVICEVAENYGESPLAYLSICGEGVHSDASFKNYMVWTALECVALWAAEGR